MIAGGVNTKFLCKVSTETTLPWGSGGQANNLKHPSKKLHRSDMMIQNQVSMQYTGIVDCLNIVFTTHRCSLEGAEFEKNKKFLAKFFNFSSSLPTGMKVFDQV